MARVVLSGASGLIGKRIAAALTSDGHRVLRLVRRAPSGDSEIAWDPANRQLDPAKLAGAEAFIHLSGEPIAGRWSEAKKREIADSRLVSTKLVAETLARLESKPALLCASAIGYYGDRGSEWLEEASPRGNGILADLCGRWERACDPAREAGLRVVNLRFGLVLDRDEGVLKLLATPYKLGLGGRMGAGTQYVSWLTSADLVAAVRHVLVSPALVGPVNLVAPAPVPNSELSATLARVLQRPALLPVPAALLRLALGEAADEMLLASQRVRPAKLAASGFQFLDPQLEPALRRLLG